jgi:hypothetical protein
MPRSRRSSKRRMGHLLSVAADQALKLQALKDVLRKQW